MDTRAGARHAPTRLRADEAMHLGHDVIEIGSLAGAFVHTAGHELPETAQSRVGQPTHLLQHVAQARLGGGVTGGFDKVIEVDM